MPTDPISILDSLTSLGAAGFMGAMWLWERRTSQVREQQIDEAHARIMADRVQLDALVDLVERNTQVITRLAASINCQPKQQVKP